MKIIESNVQAAMAVLQHYAKTYGTTGAESMQRMAVLSMYACLIGRASGVATDFRIVLKDLTLDDPFAREETLPAAADGLTVLLTQEEHDRNMAILGGLIFDSMQRNLTITEEAAAAARGPGDWPEAGIFVPFSTVVAAMEAGAGLQDTVTGGVDDPDKHPEETDDEDEDDSDDNAAIAAERRRVYGDMLAERTKTQLQSIASDLGVTLDSGLNKQAMIDAVLDSPDLDYEALDASLGNHPSS